MILMLLLMIVVIFMAIGTFNYTGVLQNYIVPLGVTSITIEAYGASGGNGGYFSSSCNPGKGAMIKGDFAVNPGDQLDIMVGQKGLEVNIGTEVKMENGGSFIFNNSSSILLVAAGGGGGVGFLGECDGDDAVVSNDGTQGNWNGGNEVTWDREYTLLFWNASGGGGYTGNGFDGGDNSTGGYSYINGGSGGNGGTTHGADGGYGGSGGSNVCGGGGGGYSGGGGGSNSYGGGGGGGSYSIGVNQNNMAGIQDGNGLVIISYSIPSCLGCIDSLATNYDSLSYVDDGSCYYCNITNNVTTNNPSSLTACDGWAISNANSNYPINTYTWYDLQNNIISTSSFSVSLL